MHRVHYWQNSHDLFATSQVNPCRIYFIERIATDPLNSFDLIHNWKLYCTTWKIFTYISFTCFIAYGTNHHDRAKCSQWSFACERTAVLLKRFLFKYDVKFWVIDVKLHHTMNFYCIQSVKVALAVNQLGRL